MSLPHGDPMGDPDPSSNKTPGLHRSNFVPTHISPVSGPRLVMPLRAMSAQRVLLALLSSLLAARCDLPTPGASDFDVSGHQNRVQRIELKASLAIPDGGEMQLPILVDPAPIAVWGVAGWVAVWFHTSSPPHLLTLFACRRAASRCHYLRTRCGKFIDHALASATALTERCTTVW